MVRHTAPSPPAMEVPAHDHGRDHAEHEAEVV